MEATCSSETSVYNKLTRHHIPVDGILNIITVLRDTEWGNTDWIDLADDRDQCRTLVNTVMNVKVP
jgi:hypothetical protein